MESFYKTANGTFDYDRDAGALNQAEASVDKAAATFEQEKARLFRQDGKPKYAPDEHNERMKELLEPVREAVAAAKQTADEVRARCDEEMKIQNADPLLRLTDPAEQQEVTYKQGLIENDASKLPLSTLAERLEAIALHGSKVEKLLYARFGRRRVEEIQQQMRNQPRVNPLSLGERGNPLAGYKAPDGLGQVVRALDTLEKATVDPKLQERLKRAEERRNAATRLTMHATQRRNVADGSDARARQQHAQYVHNMF